MRIAPLFYLCLLIAGAGCSAGSSGFAGMPADTTAVDVKEAVDLIASDAGTGMGGPCDDQHPCAIGHCNPIELRCVACVVNSDCGPNAYCSGNLCLDTTSCSSDLDCKPMVCVPEVGICVPCLQSADCAEGETCVDQQCAATQKCASSNDCPRLCDKLSGNCIDCFAGSDCGKGEFCDSTGHCSPQVCDAAMCVGGVFFSCREDGSGYMPGADCAAVDACQTDGACTQTGCEAKVLSCDDSNPCTTDTCSPAIGCKHTANSFACDDGDPCTSGDSCKATVCSGTLLSCDDGDVCTSDSCVNPGVCNHQPLTGPVCTDDNACTTDDACLSGLCKGTQMVCDDGNPCTQDVCNAKSGCANVPSPGLCDDDNTCTSGDVCTAGSCSGTPVVCDDGLLCTVDTCAGLKGCVSSPHDEFCADDNPCTEDVCDAGNGCLNSPIVALCDDDNVCTLVDACVAGLCSGSEPKVCDDNNICTDDSCDKAKGCQTKPNTAPCDDGQSCSVGDLCSGGSCASKELVFTKPITLAGLEGGRSVVKLGDGFAILAYEKVKLTYDRYIAHLVGTDGFGDVLWSKSYPDVQFYGSPSGLFVLNDGLLIVGTDKPENCANRPRAMKVDLAGEFIWDKAYGPKCQEGKQGEANTALSVAGGFLVAGRVGYAAWVSRQDATGTVIWETLATAIAPPSASSRVGCVAPTSDGYLLAGSLTVAPNDWPQGWVTRMTTDGKVQWTKTLPSTVFACAVLPTGYLLAGEGVVRTDLTGQVLWQKPHYGSAVAALDDGFALGGSQLSRFNHDGVKLWSRPLSGVGPSNLVSLDDGFAIVRTSEVGTPTNYPILIRTDSFGLASCVLSGQCAGLPLDGCDDADVCTLDVCSADVGCTHTEIPDCAP